VQEFNSSITTSNGEQIPIKFEVEEVQKKLTGQEDIDRDQLFQLTVHQISTAQEDIN